jgi:glucosamine--fructose-6-phosphate aminotransferase (isomerizing)
MLQILAFYRTANAVSLARGLDPDRPAGLAKITETL